MARRTPRRSARCSRPWRGSNAAKRGGAAKNVTAAADVSPAEPPSILVENPMSAREGLGTFNTHRQRSETRDGMRIDWDVPIEMDDGVVLKADVFRPTKPGKYPV